MKITNVEAIPVWGGDEAYGGTARNYLFVVVDTDEGISGVGESGLTARELAVAGVIDHFKPLLRGQDPFRIEHIWQMLSRGGFFPAENVTTSAISAVDIALWDIKGKALGVPVYELLGGRVRDRVVCYPHNARKGLSTQELVESCLATVAEGWKFVRWSLPFQGNVLEPRRSLKAALAQMQAVREAVGDDIEICFDLLTALDPAQAIWFCAEAKQYRPFFIEDPLRVEDTNSFRLLRQKTALPIAAGEQLSSKWRFRQLIEEDLIDYCRMDLGIVGGISEGHKLAGWCETHYIKTAPHNPLSPLTTAASLHLDLAHNNFGVQEQPVKPGTLLTDVFPVQMEWQDGHLLPPTRPGLGIEFDREAARRRPFQMCKLPLLYREDGSLTNW